jgi:Flp pilus assembly protein TadD
VIGRTGNPELMDAAAAILEERGEHEEARALRTRAHEGHEARIAMYPEAAYGHALGHYLEHEGDEARAVEIAERNRDVRPNGEAWTQLAQAYARAGRLEEARAAITHVRATPYRSLELDETAEEILASR